MASQNTPSVPGSAETNDFFGAKVTTADMNKDGDGDVVVTAPGEDDGARHGVFTILWGSKSANEVGRLYLLPGMSSGPAGTGSTLLTTQSLALGARPCIGAGLPD
ncbi:FG-GAP repeat protein [Streptomyces herbicida]|uniref:FG-GAP repeat protein n=1 Tax=Streptomyces herbicida TaxID=3065675 RepID=UPI00292E6F6C|nr:FG-GAP repeat protein [Streptomyces sp. NEAU-HV9]